MEFQLSYYKSLKMMLLKCSNQYASKFENSAMVTRLEKVSFHSNPKKRRGQIMFKLPHNCTHLTYQENNAQNSPGQASTVHEARTSRCSTWIQKRQRKQRLKCQQLLGHRQSKRIPEKHLLLIYSLCASHQTVENYSRDGNTRPLYLPPGKSV